MYCFLKHEAFLLNSFLFSKRFCFYILYVHECVAWCVFFQHMCVCVHGVQGGQKVPDPLGWELHSTTTWLLGTNPRSCARSEGALNIVISPAPFKDFILLFVCACTCIYWCLWSLEDIGTPEAGITSHWKSPLLVLGTNSGLLIEYKCF